jgi:hypothetical protein
MACGGDHDDAPAGGAVVVKARPLIEQVTPPIDIKAAPADATRTASGLSYKKLVESAGGPQPTGGDVAMIRYTGWRQRTGETFFTTKGRTQPIAIDLANAAPGFREALQLMHKGESMVLWLPSGDGTLEPVVYQIDVADIIVSQARSKKG